MDVYKYDVRQTICCPTYAVVCGLFELYKICIWHIQYSLYQILCAVYYTLAICVLFKFAISDIIRCTDCISLLSVLLYNNAYILHSISTGQKGIIKIQKHIIALWRNILLRWLHIIQTNHLINHLYYIDVRIKMYKKKLVVKIFNFR